MKEIKVVTWVADDGTEFSSRGDCIDHEGESMIRTLIRGYGMSLHEDEIMDFLRTNKDMLRDGLGRLKDE